MIPKTLKELAYPANPKMNGKYTVKTSFYENSKIIVNSLYIGKKIDKKNEMEIISKRTLDKRILDLMGKQAKRLSKNPKLNPIITTINLQNAN